jgi:hypothetical protein
LSIKNNKNAQRERFEIPTLRSLNLQKHIGSIDVQWYIGGSIIVDNTFLCWHLRPKSFNVSSKISNWSKYVDELYGDGSLNSILERNFSETENIEFESLSEDSVKSHYFPIKASPSFQGKSRWEQNTSFFNHTLSSFSEHDPIKPLSFFSAIVHPAFKTKSNELVSFPPGQYWLISWASVDISLTSKGQGEPKDFFPQSHVSNVRANSEWKKENVDLRGSTRIVKGRKYWPSDPIVIRISEDNSILIESECLQCAWWNNII